LPAFDELPEIDPSDYESSDELGEIDFDVAARRELESMEQEMPAPEPFDSGDCAWSGEPDYYQREDGS
jgi:hypothetical protein